MSKKSNGLGVASFNETVSYKFFILKLRVADYESNLELQFSILLSQTLRLQAAKVFLRVELLNCMLLKPFGVTGD